jgi:CDP-paratose 2-epimerase
MSIAVVTGSGGLIGSAAVRHFADAGLDVIGIDNDARAQFFGDAATTRPVSESLVDELPDFRWVDLDIRDEEPITALFRDRGAEIELVVHAAAQPSHDWAADDPHKDFTINANGTLNLLEATRQHCPEATFAFLSTNKVYGDTPNDLPLEDVGTRLDLPRDHRWHSGVDTTMSIDRSTHSLFGVSKAAADLLVQEYGRYFELATACFRCGCLTGPDHAGTRLHGFLAYLMKCAATGSPYTVYGYEGKQVRDNLHARDVASAIAAFHSDPAPGRVYNLGGGRANSCSMLEAIDACERIVGSPMNISFHSRARTGDHRWWISALGEFEADYPDWRPEFGLDQILQEIYDDNVTRWSHSAA